MVKLSSRKGKRGFTLITALAFTLIVGTVLAGVGTVALSHVSRSKVEGDYAGAVALADAGVNYEIQAVSADLVNLTGVSQQSNPYTGSVAGVDGTFKVFVKPWGTGCNGSGNWAPPADLCIESMGTVHGINRTVYVRGRRKSAFDQYAIYAYNVAFVNGVGNSSKTGVEGDMGTNSSVQFKGSQGSTAVHGTLALNGSGASIPNNQNGGNVVNNPDSVFFPTVSQVADQMFGTGGLIYLQTHNVNANIMMLKSGDTTLASEPTVSGFTSADVASKLTTAGFTTLSRSLSTVPLTPPNDSSTLDLATSGTRFMEPADPTHDAVSIGANTGGPTYFLPPGDYYFSDLKFQNKASWILLTHLGNIRIWVDSNSTTDDDISKLTMIFTSNDPTRFRLYYNKCANLTMHGQGVFDGSIYAMRDGCKNGLPGIDLEGGDEIYGSVIAGSFTLGGGSWVVFPNTSGNDNGNDPSLWYGFKDSWKEIPPNNSSNPVFVDGTSN